jgi:thiol-disulfide isomerase/thioredoxin
MAVACGPGGGGDAHSGGKAGSDGGASGTNRGNKTTIPVVDATALKQRVAASSGHPLLLVFWATWCKPCVEELPDLVALQQEAPSGLHIIACSLDDFLSGDSTQTIVAEYLRGHPAPLDHVIYRGSQDAVFDAFELPGNIPYSILYDAKGSVVQRFTGGVQPGAVHAALGSSVADTRR